MNAEGEINEFLKLSLERCISTKRKHTVQSLLKTKLDKYLSRITPFGFSGAILITKKDRIVLDNGYGMAIREKCVANTPDTVFCTGSITKQFTAAAIMKLWMKGKLRPSDKINNYFREVPRKKKSIILHNLLTHTAGLVDSVGDDYDLIGRDEFIRRVLNEPLHSQPGTVFRYSNAGYGLLAAIIEIISSQPYEEFLHEQMFVPSEMNFTGYRIPDWNKRVVADWYVEGTNNKNSLDKTFPQWNLIGNGGILSTTGELFKWHLALKGEKLLSRKAKEIMFTPFLNNYAYGWDVSESENGLVVQHDGANMLGATADFKWFVNHDIATILLCNLSSKDSLGAMQVRDKIVKLVFGGTIQLPLAVTGYQRDLGKFEGVYSLAQDDWFSISLGNDLILAAKGQRAIDAMFLPERVSADNIERLNRRTLAIWKRISKGDFGLFLDMLEDKNTFDRKREFISKVLGPTELGLITRIEVEGTVPYSRREDAFETIVRITLENKPLTISLIWHDGRLWGIPGQSSKPEMLLKPVTESRFAGYNLGLARGAIVDFILNSRNQVTGLTLNCRVAAHRIEGSS